MGMVMFANDILLAFFVMALLFVRQVWILKRPNKINYAPLMIGIGAIASVLHFILHPDPSDVILLLRESFIPLLISLLLYIVMNILQQTQQSQQAKMQEEFTRVLVSEVTSLKKFMTDLEARMILSQQEDQQVREEVRKKFQEDIQALDAIQVNQATFAKRIDEMQAWHEEVSKGFAHFTEVQLPGLDDVVHKHIDILRVSEQDHFNKIQTTLNKAVESRCDIADDIDELKKKLGSMKNISDEIAHAITKHTLQQLSGVTKAFESQIVTLKSHSEGVRTSLLEGETTLAKIRQQSELIMKQMVLSAKKMDELESQNSGLHDIYSTVKEIIVDIEAIRADYIKAQSQLSHISKEISDTKDEQLQVMQKKIDTLNMELRIKIDESLEKLHEHYHITSGELSESVQLLAKQAQLKKSGYGDV